MENSPHRKRHRRMVAAGAALAALAAVALCVFGIKGDYLLLRNAESGRVIYCTPAGDGESFSVSFTHSVNKSPVSEFYEIRGLKIYLTHLRFRAFGAGMPTAAEEGQTLRLDGPDMVIEGFSREMPDLRYFIGRVAGHSLSWRGEEIPLDSLDRPGEPVAFSVVRYPRALMLLKIYPPD